MKGSNVSLAADMGARHHLDEIAAAFHAVITSVGVSAPGNTTTSWRGANSTTSGSQPVAGEKLRAGIETLLRSRLVHHAAGAHDHMGVPSSQLGDELYRAGHGERDLRHRDAALSDGVNGE